MKKPIIEVMNLPLLEDDIQEFVNLDQQNMAYAWNADQWRELKSSEYCLFAIGTNAQEKLGFSLYHLAGDQAHLLKIAVDKSARCQGLASELMRHDSDFLKSNGHRSIYLEVAVTNQSAIGFYLKHGFKVLIIKKKFYSDGADANAMSLQLK